MSHEREPKRPLTTTNFGSPAPSDEYSLTVGPGGPNLLQDSYLIEKLAHFVRERIPDRVYHVKGGGAFGYFEVTADVTQWTKAAFLNKVGKRTPLFLRFSIVAADEGAPDTDRDVRGVAIKFYTEEGNYDIVGNNTPIFFVRDPMKFPDFIHSQLRLPDTGIRSNNMQWDFWTPLARVGPPSDLPDERPRHAAHLAQHEPLLQQHLYVGERRGQEVLGQVPLQDRAGRPELHRRRGQGHVRQKTSTTTGATCGMRLPARTTRPGAWRCRSCRSTMRSTIGSTPSTSPRSGHTRTTH